MPESVPQASAEREPARLNARPDWDEIEQMLDELPPGIPILPPEDATNFSKYRYPPPMMPAPQAWKICSDAMEKYDSELCKAYREEIDTLLVFAGLFSAVVTGFTVESYQWLQDDPSDMTNALLAQIARSMAPNGTAHVLPSSPGMARSVSARINAYWFISLALSLSAALVAILGKQWVREFERRAADMNHKDAVGVRQLKFEGLEYWKVGDIISALPMLLQLSLALFALGILELLWHLHVAVAIALCIPTALAILFYLTTTLIPVLQYAQRHRGGPLPPQCAYKSPQALAVIHVYQVVVRVLCYLRMHCCCLCFSDPPFYWRDREVWNNGWTNTWSKWDYGFHATDRYSSQRPLGKSHSRGLVWLQKNVDERTVGDAYWNCLWEQAHSVETHSIDILFRRDENPNTTFMTGIDRAIKEQEISRSMDPLWQRALPFLKRTDMSREALSEILIQSLPAMTVSTAKFILGDLELEFSNDPELVRSLVRVVLSYERQHLDEDIYSVINSTSNIIARCPDYATESVLQWVLVSLAANGLWLHWPVVESPYVSTISHAFDMLSRSPEGFVHHPQRLHHLPHILVLAACLRAEYQFFFGHLTWPMTVPNYIRRYTMDGTGNSHPEWKPMVMEVFKISVRGIDRGRSAGPSAHANGRGDGIVHAAPPLEAAPPAGTAGPAVIETARSAENLPSPEQDALHPPLHTAEIAPAVDVASAVTLEIVVVPAGGDVTRTSVDPAVTGSLDLEETSVQDAVGGPARLLAVGSGGYSAGNRRACDTGAPVLGRESHALSTALPQENSGVTPPRTSAMSADPTTPRGRDSLLALPDAVDAHAHETVHANDPAEHASAHDAAEQLDGASDLRAGMPPPHSTTVAFADGRSSAVSDNADVSQTLTDGISTGAGGGNVRAADEELASFAPHARTEQPELSIPLESHQGYRTSRTDTRALDAASDEEGRARIEGSDPTGQLATQLRESEEETGETGNQSARVRKLSERALEYGAILEPSRETSIASDAAGSRTDDQSGAKGIRERPDDVGDGGEPHDG